MFSSGQLGRLPYFCRAACLGTKKTDDSYDNDVVFFQPSPRIIATAMHSCSSSVYGQESGSGRAVSGPRSCHDTLQL